MEIIRIPSSYYSQIEYLNKDDAEYVFKTIFSLAYWNDIKVEKSMRWWLVLSIWREAIQMENKARAKKWEERLEIDIATLMADTDDTLWSWNSATKSSKVKSNQVKENQINTSKDLSKDKEQSSTELVIDNRNIDINQMQEIIKQKVLSLWLIYKAWKQERNRIKNILTAKEFWEICEKSNMSREQFVVSIIELSTKLEFWNWKIYNWETLYSHYAKVYNEAVKVKNNLSSKKWVWITSI